MMQSRDIAAVLDCFGIDHSQQAGCMIRPPETELVLKTTKNSRLDPSPLGLNGLPLAPSDVLCRPPPGSPNLCAISSCNFTLVAPT